MKFDSGLKFRWVDGEEQKRNEKMWHVYRSGSFDAGPYGYLHPRFLRVVDGAYNFKWRPDDVLLIGHPKTGTSWVQQVLWTMRNDSNLDHPCSDQLNYYKVMFLEYEAFYELQEVAADNSEIIPKIRKYCPTLTNNDFCYREMWEHLPDPRVMKTHFAFDVIDPKVLDKSKVVFLMRNPKDALVSYYYFSKTLAILQYRGTIDEYVDDYIDGKILYGSIFEHFKNVWEHRNHPNMYILFYEDIRSNTMEEIQKLDKFLGTDLTEQQIKNVQHKTSFKVMKEKDPFFFGSNTFVQEGDYYRKGQVGDSKEQLSPASSAKLNKFCREFFAPYDLPYDFSD